MLRYSLIYAITGYQKYVSPYKGFSCAHRVRHGGLSCSEHVKQTLQCYRLFDAIPAINARFKACKMAAFELRNDQHVRSQERERRGVRHRDKSTCVDSCNCCDVMELVPNVLEGASCDADFCACSL